MSYPSGIAAPKFLRMKAFARNMRILGFLYAAFAVVFWFFPNELLYALNIGPKVLHVTEALPDPTDKLWIVFGATYFGLLAALCLLAAESPYTRGYSLAHLLANILAALGFGVLFLNDHRYFAYAFICALEAVLSLVLTWNLFRLGLSPRKMETVIDSSELDPSTQILPPGDAL